MEIKTLVQNIYFPLAYTTEQDINMGQSPETRFHWPLDLPYLSSLGRNHGAPPK
jgi:hypothetical protein